VYVVLILLKRLKNLRICLTLFTFPHLPVSRKKILELAFSASQPHFYLEQTRVIKASYHMHGIIEQGLGLFLVGLKRPKVMINRTISITA
jgi:hypothetical protein